MTTLDEAYLKTINLLNSQENSYIVIGGLAVGMLGEARMTHDVDVLIAIDKKDINSFLELAKNNGFAFDQKTIDSDFELKGAFRIVYDSFPVDFIVGRMPFEKEAFKRSIKLKLFKQSASFPTPEDLILFKLIPGREKDILDAKSIVLRHKNKLDISYMEKWAQVISDDLQDMRVWNSLKNLLKDI